MVQNSVCIGCGVTTDVDGKLIVHTSGTKPLKPLLPASLGFTCDVEDNYGRIVCGDDGKLYGPPEHTSAESFVAFGATVGPSASQVWPAQTDFISPGPAATLVNPSPCRFMMVDLEVNGRLRFDITRSEFEANGGAAYTVNCETFISFNGAGFQLWRNETWFHGSTQADEVTVVGHGAGGNIVQPPLIPPGGTLTVDWLYRITALGNPSGRVLYNPPSLRLMGHTQ